jgi:N-glycosylase/DNA lyase
MEITPKSDKLLIKNIRCFNLDLTLGCGQAFRWQKNQNGRWRGVAFGKALNISQNMDGSLVLNTSVSDFEQVWRGYFDLDRDYSRLCETFCTDSSLKTAVEQFPGIRILRQEPWEALCSFIISQNNNIPRIKGIVERLCSAFGENIGNGDFTFPLGANNRKTRR